MYYYYKSIIFEFENNPSFNKIIISNNEITMCVNDLVKKNIQDKIKNLTSDIFYVEFYVSLYDYEIIENDIYWNTIKHIDKTNLPIYKKQDDLNEYLNWLNKHFNNNNVRIYETSKFTIRRTNFSNDENKTCLDSVGYKNTNKKFNNFNQIFYHAGDNDDIERFGYLFIRAIYQKEKKYKLYSGNIFAGDDKLKIWDKFEVDFESIKNTMDYMFNQMKKGILVGIKNNKLAIFLPFSKYNYANDFYTELYFDSQDKKNLEAYKRNPNDFNVKRKLENTLKYYLLKNKLNSKNIILDRKKWVANDCFFRYENYEGDKSEALYEDFFAQLCANRDLPDCIFFLNLRDHPMLNKNLKNSYTSIIDKKLDGKYIHNKYAPILSPGGSIETADICMCTQDDWLRISKKIYPDDCANNYLRNIETVGWDKKINKAVFRGSATGCGINTDDNVRIKASELSAKYPEYLDAGITTFNRKIKKNLNEPLKVINFGQTKTKANFMTLKDKAQFKYILNLDGHVSAFRLGHELSLFSVVLIPKSKYYLWFSHLLEPYVHFVPIKQDLSDLIEQIKWCIEHDSECKKIAYNGLEFYKKYLEKDGVFDYMQKILNSISPKSLNFKKYNQKIAIITIYRNKPDNTRLQQKRLYLYLMNKILYQICEYDIILVEQSEKYLFNIGKLKNIGFDYLCKNSNTIYSNYIFADIDTIPDSNLIDYFFKTTDSINSLAVKGTRYESNDKKDKRPFAGALISCTKNVFIELNGYPNNFYGWQGEDENLLIRIYANNKPVYIPTNGKIIDIEEVDGYKKNMEIKSAELKNEKEKNSWEKNYNWENYKQNGLTNLNYNVLYENKFVFGDNTNCNNYHIIVDLKQDSDMKKYPKDYTFENTHITKDDYKNLMRNTIYKIEQIPLEL